MPWLIWSVAMVFVVSSMLSVALRAEASTTWWCITDKKQVGRAVLANIVLVPVWGALLALTIPLPRDARTAILLMALLPGGLGAIQFTAKMPSAIRFAAQLALFFTVVALLVSPLVTVLVFTRYPSTGRIPYPRLVLIVVFALLVPLVLGSWLGRKSLRIADRLALPLAVVGTIAFVLLTVLLLGLRREAMASLSTAAIAVMALFVLGTMVLGWWLGGPTLETRSVLASATSMRNAALAYIIASRTVAQSGLVAAVLTLSALMVPPNVIFLLYTLIHQRQCRRRDRHSDA